MTETATMPPADELIELRSRLTRRQIADHYKVSLARVKRWVAELGLPSKISREDSSRTTTNVREKPIAVPYDDGLSLMERCKLTLGRRMGEDHRGYTLDGRPCSSDQIRRAVGL